MANEDELKKLMESPEVRDGITSYREEDTEIEQIQKLCRKIHHEQDIAVKVSIIPSGYFIEEFGSLHTGFKIMAECLTFDEVIKELKERY